MEPLEPRQLLSAAALIGVPAVGPNAEQPGGTASPTGLSPTQIRHAYGFDQISGTGQGQTIAIVDAYLDPTITSDLHQFDLHYGLSDPTLQILNQSGKAEFGSYGLDPTGGWPVETALDVEWAHVVAPNAKIVLVEAQTAAIVDLMAAVNTARYLPGVSTISMSFGWREDPTGEPGGYFPINGQQFYLPATGTDFYYNRFLLTPAGHQPETFIAASGDDGVAATSFPATSPNVLSVGGTRLTLDSSNNYQSESVWIGSQGGESSYQPTPAYQAAVSKTRFRATPDVSYNADTVSGVSVYNTTATDPTDPIPASEAWLTVGGTSAGSPQWAGLIADINQMRVSAGRNTLDGVNETLPALYQLAMGKKTRYENNFNDIATGQNGDIVTSELPINPVPLNTVPNPRGGGYTGIPATPGYDMATGLGTPKVPAISQYLAAFVPVKVVHRSAKQRAIQAAAAAAKAVKPAASSATMSAQFAFADAGLPIVVSAAPVAPAPTVAPIAPPAAFTVKPMDASTDATYVLKLAVAGQNAAAPLTTEVTAATAAPVTSASADLALTGAYLTGNDPAMLADDPSNAPAAAPAATPVNTAVPPAAVPAVPQQDDAALSDAPVIAPQGAISAAIVEQATEAAAAATSLPGLVAPAVVGANVVALPAAKVKATTFKPTVPMLAGVVAADAVVVGQWLQRRAEAKRRKAAGFSFGLTLVTPQDDDQVC